MANTVTAAPRSLVATVVAVCPPELHAETAGALASLRARTAVRTILVTLGGDTQPAVQQEDEATVIEGLVPRYLNNAVASLRLSSLPTLVWWRGPVAPAAVALREVAALVDRLVLDAADPAQDWAEALPLVELTGLSDFRWTRLTRWRHLTAQFFDMPEVRATLSTFRRLTVSGADVYTLKLYAAWLETRLPHGRDLAVEFSSTPTEHPMDSVTFTGDAGTLELRLLANRTCIETRLHRQGDSPAARIVALGDQSLPTLLVDELRVRSRDEAFEQALRRAVTR